MTLLYALIWISVAEGLIYLMVGTNAQYLALVYPLLIYIGLVRSPKCLVSSLHRVPAVGYFLAYSVLLLAIGALTQHSWFTAAFYWKQLYLFAAVVLLVAGGDRKLNRLIILAGIATGLLGLVEWLVGPSWVSWLNSSLDWRHVEVLSYFRLDYIAGVYRVNSSFRDSFNFGDFSAVVLLLSLLSREVNPVVRIAAGGLAAIGVWISGSRDSLLFAGVAIVSALLYVRMGSRGRWAVLLGSLLLPGLVLILGSKVLLGLGLTGRWSLGSVGIRMDNWVYVIQSVWQPHNWSRFLFGGGLGTTIAFATGQLLPIDNFYLFILTESGVTALLGWLIFGGWLAKRFIAERDNRKFAAAFGLLAGMAAASWFRPEWAEFPLQLIVWALLGNGVGSRQLRATKQQAGSGHLPASRAGTARADGVDATPRHRSVAE